MRLKIETSTVAPASYHVHVGHGYLGDLGRIVRRAVGRKAHRLALVSNTTVYPLYGEAVASALREAGFAVEAIVLRDGERYKHLRAISTLADRFSSAGLTRGDAVVALGGGVIGDTAGFAAAVYLRGIPHIQVPTTLLAMIDSSVGGKTGINTQAGKNRIGAFHPPAAVIADVNTLSTLPQREMTAGFFEAVKHAVLSGRELFELTFGILGTDARMGGRNLVHLIAKNIAFKASIVAGDERESAGRSDPGSRKVLNLGHTFAHAVESVTGYRRLRHGEAVGHGLRFAAELSKNLALLSLGNVQLLNDVLHRAGTLPAIQNVDPGKVLEAFGHDKKKLGRELQFVLLKGIGRPVIVSARDIPNASIRQAVHATLQYPGK